MRQSCIYTVPRKLLRLVEPGELERRSVPGSLFQVSQACIYIYIFRSGDNFCRRNYMANHMMAEIALERDRPSSGFIAMRKQAAPWLACIADARGGAVISRLCRADFCGSSLRSSLCHERAPTPSTKCSNIAVLAGWPICLVLRYRATWEGGRLWPTIVNNSWKIEWEGRGYSILSLIFVEI